MSTGLFLGKSVDPATGALGAPLHLDPRDLLTHGLIVGMTGSGKTGLAIALLEEVLRRGTSVVAIDPKGDLVNLLLQFDRLDAASFEPWIDPAEARRQGLTVAQAAAAEAEKWKQGLAEWGLAPTDVAALRAAVDARVYTPGSDSGLALSVLQSLEAPSVPFDTAAEDLRDEIAAIVSGLLGLVQVDADPLKSREHILLCNLIEHAWRAGRSLTLEDLLGEVVTPPIDKLGALPVETVFPSKDRQGLVMALNGLLASPGFAAWRRGEPIDVDSWLSAEGGRARLNIIYTAHLSDEERLFVTALVLEKVKTWVRRQRGTGELRALVYMDEVFGYFPPHPANPPTKKPLLTLLKQARAQGVGVLLATQNPVDLDYKGLANMGTWMVGKLQTERDRERLRDGLLGAGADAARIDALLDATKKRVFLLHDVHRKGPELLHSRWAMSYLRGPLTREEIEPLMAVRKAEAAAAPVGGSAAAARPAATAPAAPAAPAGPPLAPSPFRHHALRQHGGEVAEAHVFVKAAVRYKGVDGERIVLRAWPVGDGSFAEMLDADALVIDEDALDTAMPAGLRFPELPGAFAAGSKALDKALRERLPDKLSERVLEDPVTGERSRPDETREAFATRLAAAPGAEAKKLEAKLEKRRRDLAAAESDLSTRKKETWVAVGSAILSNIGLFTGRKKSVSLPGGVLTKNRMENTAEARVESAQADIAQLEAQLAELRQVEPSRFVEAVLVPPRNGVKLLRYDLVWVY
ncbi:MAG: DUF87 domain-containing protein [Vicinamibacteria bacterium]|nr:DUF87 domain-containing protein [Vicinamibacteria bacterium]